MAAAQAMLDDIHPPLPTHTGDTNTYVLGNIKQHQVVITCLPAGQYGTNNAATVMTNLKRTFSAVRLSLMVGIGGGVPSMCDVYLGDVVVGTRVMQYDLGKIVEDGKFQRKMIPRTLDMLLGTAVSALRAKHELCPSRIPSILQQKLEVNPKYGRPKSPDRLFLATYDHLSPLTANCDGCDHSKILPRHKRNADNIVIHYGAIASGNQVMRHGVTRDNVARELDVVCFEMESAGLMDILPCLPIRGICDYSDSHKNKEWQRYAAATAAAYARELIEEIPLTKSRVEMNDIPNMHELLSSDRRECLLESLRFDQIDSRRLTIKRAHDKTCRWLLGHAKYEEWLNPMAMTQHHGFLWISGKPGAGKSTIMKFAYLNLKREPCFKNTIIVSFFFNARGDSLEKSISGMYRSLLLQLLEGYPDLQTVLDDPEVVSRSQNHCPSLNILKELFCSAVSALGNRLFTCFIDALDECDEQHVVDMVQCFEDLAENSTAKGVSFRVCFSSRRYPYISIRRGIRLTLEDQLEHTEDLASYATSRLVVADLDLNKELRSNIIDKSAGVFMWVVLVVDILNREDRRGGMFLRKRLAEIPSDLNELFKDILSRDTDNMEALLLCVIWILYANQPLQPNEFYHAVWSGLALKDLVDDQIPDVAAPNSSDSLNKFKRYVISSSKGLAETTKAKQPTVQFIHESVRDFLVKEKGLYQMWPEFGYDCESLSHEKLKQCCNIYLNHSSVRQSVRKMLSEPNSSMQQETSECYPFLKYANQHILHHANAAAKAYPQEEFISGLAFSEWILVNNLFEKFKIRRFSSTNASLVYIFAEKGLSELIRTIVHDEPQVYMSREKYKYPLFAALASGSKDTVAAILGLSSTIQNGVDIIDGTAFTKNLKEYGSRTPLSWAAQSGRAEIVKLLRTEQTVNEVDKAGHTALTRASMNGHEEVVRLLIESGADIHAIDKDGFTSLQWALKNSREAVAKLLIEKGADIHAIDKDGCTSLQWALENGREAVAKLLIEKGADIHAIGKDGRTLLHQASAYGQEAVVRLLIEKGAYIHAIDNDGSTSLHQASQRGQEAVVRLLIEKGAYIHAIDNDGSTSLHQASQRGQEAVVRHLIEKGADTYAYNENGWTSLHIASKHGHEAVVRYLIENGANIHAIGEDGRTSLHWASGNSRAAVVRLLIEKGADIHAIDNHGWTSLHWASGNGRTAVVKLLIEKGADIHTIDNYGWTSLHWASGNGHEEVARLLIENGQTPTLFKP